MENTGQYGILAHARDYVTYRVNRLRISYHHGRLINGGDCESKKDEINLVFDLIKSTRTLANKLGKRARLLESVAKEVESIGRGN